jgi:DNA uptake protein ComE-like DNA-binding protein
MMNKKLKDYLTFSSRERKAILILLSLMAVLLGFNLFLRYGPLHEKRFNNHAYLRSVDSFLLSLRAADSMSGKFNGEEDYPILNPFPFDPNQASEEELIRLGIEKRIAGRILAYRNKGGRFRQPEDLLKIYGFDPQQYAFLSPYITLDTSYDRSGSRVMPAAEKKHREPVQLEINASDSADLTKLPGIGPVLATRIIKYRELLGGMAKTDQLTEVYGISDSLVNTLKDKVWTDSSRISRININEATEARLGRHPYIGRYSAKAILSYRKSAGIIHSFDELRKNNLISKEYEERLKYYLQF